jgi:hypothetical protein
VTKKFDWQPVAGAQDVNVEVQRVQINQITFDLGSTMKGTPIRKSSAKAKLGSTTTGSSTRRWVSPSSSSTTRATSSPPARAARSGAT